MNVDLGKVTVDTFGIIHHTDAWEAVQRHAGGDWAEATPNEQFNNDYNVVLRKGTVLSRHTDRFGTRFVVETDFKASITTLRLE